MDPDDHVCLCFRVSLRKIRAYLRREDPPVASLISECLGAGTGCGWCVPFLTELHRQHRELASARIDGGETGGSDAADGGAAQPDLKISPERYANERAAYRRTGRRDAAQSNTRDEA
jgi:bacterioferritin-associated ferredoxin